MIRCKKFEVGLVLAVSGLLWALAVGADDWPRWRGPDWNGVSRETGWNVAWPKEGPPKLWSANVSTGFSSVVVSANRLFTLGNRHDVDTVFCFDASTGTPLWQHSYPCPLDPIYYEGGPGATPTVDGQRVYTLSKRGHLFCFEAATGQVLWQKNLLEDLGVQKPRWGFAGSPLVEGDLLLLNVGDGGTALDKTTGQVVWVGGKDPAGYATPTPLTLGGERSALFFSGKALVCSRMRDGRELWRFPWEERWQLNAADPIVAGDRVFVSTFGRGAALLEVSVERPTLLWTNRCLAVHFNSAVLLDGYLYGIDGNTDAPPKDLRCVELATGQVKWRHAGLGLGSLMAADGKLIVLGERGELVVAAASPEAFQPLARAQVLGGKCWTVPVLANGRIYCRNARGDLVCLDVRGAGS